MYPSHTSIAASGWTGVAMGVQPMPQASPRQSRPMPTLVAGPTVPISSSVCGATASFSMRATPPSANRVMKRTGLARALATRAWDSSWAVRAAKNNSPVMIARIQITPLPHCGLVT
jgi:hypothetical protein